MLHLSRAGQACILLLGQTALELGLVFLDGLHRLLKGLADVLILRKVQKVAVTRMLGEKEATLGDGDLMKRLLATRALKLLELGLNGLLVAAVVDVGEFEEDEPHHRCAILRSFEVGIRPKVIGSGPKVLFELFELCAGHFSSKDKTGDTEKP